MRYRALVNRAPIGLGQPASIPGVGTRIKRLCLSDHVSCLLLPRRLIGSMFARRHALKRAHVAEAAGTAYCASSKRSLLLSRSKTASVRDSWSRSTAERIFREGDDMAKFLMQASYTAEGLKGLHKDKASGRRTAIASALESAGGKLEATYYCFGEDDVIVIADLPDNIAASSFAMAVAASGLVRMRTTPLLTVEEVDKALAKKSTYRAPGH